MKVKSIKINGQQVGILVSFIRFRKQNNLYYAFGAPEHEKVSILSQILKVLKNRKYRDLYEKFQQLSQGTNK